MSTADPERLHTLAHRAANRVRTVEDWWDDPLTTGLAAVTRARHPSANRDEAERTVSRLKRWWRDEPHRPISRDVTALALTVRAAADLQRREPQLVEESAVGVESIANRDASIVPVLHLALCAWSLDDLVPDRDEPVWNALRERLEQKTSGVDEPLRIYAASVSARSFDPNRLVQDLLGAIGTAPSSSDACILLWLVTVAAEKMSRSLSAGDNALRVLLQRRASIVERLVGDIDDDSFIAPELGDYGDELTEMPMISYLSPFEALLIDFSLAPRDEPEAWLTYPEAEAVFGDKAAQAQSTRRAERTRLLRWNALTVAVAGIACFGVVLLGGYALDWDHGVVISLALAALCFALALSAALLQRSGLPEKWMEAIGPVLVIAGLYSTLSAYNQHRTKPFLDPVPTIVIGLVLPLSGLLIWFVATRSRDDEPAA